MPRIGTILSLILLPLWGWTQETVVSDSAMPRPFTGTLVYGQFNDAVRYGSPLPLMDSIRMDVGPRWISLGPVGGNPSPLPYGRVRMVYDMQNKEMWWVDDSLKLAQRMPRRDTVLHRLTATPDSAKCGEGCRKYRLQNGRDEYEVKLSTESVIADFPRDSAAFFPLHFAPAYRGRIALQIRRTKGNPLMWELMHITPLILPEDAFGIPEDYRRKDYDPRNYYSQDIGE